MAAKRWPGIFWLSRSRGRSASRRGGVTDLLHRAFLGLHCDVNPGDTVYIPGGAGGVGHLAVQMAARTLGAGRVISSGSTPGSIDLARSRGAHHVFDYKRDDVLAEIMKLTNGEGVHLVKDERSAVDIIVASARFVERVLTQDEGCRPTPSDYLRAKPASRFRRS